MDIYIYLISRDNYPLYVGKTNNPKTRKLNHKRTYGSTITLDILDIVDIDNWVFYESYWIEQFTQWGFILENKNQGGNGVSFHTEETKQKLSKPKNHGLILSQRNVTWGNKISKSKKGTIYSIERNNKISKANKGREITWSTNNYVCILQYNLNGNFIQEWDCISDAERFHHPNGLRKTNVINCCRNKQKQAYGFIWKYNK